MKAALRDRETESVIASAALDWAPLYGTDLPKRPPWSELSDAIEGRRLLVQAEASVWSQVASIVNQDDKTTVRIHLERITLRGPDGRHRVLRTAAVVAVRGYERSAERVCGVLDAAGLQSRDQTVLELALEALGRPAPGAPPGPGVLLDRAQPAYRAIPLVLARLRQHLVANQQGVLERLDTEFLHEFRVAVRRARSIVKQVRSCLDSEDARHFADELAWLGSLTGPVRDLDVHLEELGGETEEDLGPLRDFLAARRDALQPELVAALRSERYVDLVEGWRRLATPGPIPSSSAASQSDARAPIGGVADRYLWKAYRRVVRDGKQIGPDSPPEALHGLRKRAKELRYLLECFQALYPEEEMRTVVKELKALQDNLGEYQDCQVQAAALLQIAEEMMATGSAPASTLMAMGRLTEEQRRREALSRAEFANRFERFSSSANRHRFATLVSLPEQPQSPV